MRTVVATKVCSILLAATTVASGLLADDGKPRFVLVHGFDTLSNIHNAEEFQNKVNQAWQACELDYRPSPPDGTRPDQDEMLKLIASADVFYTNSHASLSTTGLMVRDGDILEPTEVRSGLQEALLPRVVIINGCATTARKFDDDPDNQFYRALGFGAETVGRAYVGWKVSVIGAQGDNYFSEFLVHWATPKADGSYPSLLDSRDFMEGKGGGTALSENLDVLGDANLRFDHALGFVNGVRIVGEWRVNGVRFPEDGQLVENHSFDGSRVNINRDGSLKIVLSAVDTSSGQEGVIGSFPSERWYLTQDGERTIINYSVTDPSNDQGNWQSFCIEAENAPVIKLTATDGRPGDVTLVPVQ